MLGFGARGATTSRGFGRQVSGAASRTDGNVALQEDLRDIEVIDLRSLKPLDLETIVQSVRKTGRIVGVTEAYKTGSYISELFTLVQESAFDWLDAPMVRVTARNVPVPMAESLEDAAIPSVARIVQAAAMACR